MMRQKGAVTVYLTLIFLLVLSLIFTIAESTRIQSARMLLETAVDAGLESFVAGYHKELYETYDVFFFDGSFGSGDISHEILESKLRDHMNYTLDPTRETVLHNSDFYQMNLNVINIDKLALATDDNGKVFRNQAIEYVKSSMGIAAIEQLTDRYNWAINNLNDSDTYSYKEQEIGQSLIELEDHKSAIDQEKVEEAKKANEQKNPTVEVDAIRSMGILELVCEDTSSISQKSINAAALPSQRNLSKGTGLEQYETGILSNILFQDYLMRKFNHGASGEVTEGNLQYQIEYLLIGKSHDVDNLKGMVNRLLLIREGANFAYLLTDAAKVSEAYAAALLLVGYTALPPLIEATKYGILLSWAYAESVLDVRVLMAGEKVALTKNAGNWKTSLGNIAEVATMDVSQMSDDNGITYEEYLQMMLLIANQDQLAMRALDLMELQMQYETEQYDFKIDNCVAMLETTIECDSQSIFLTMPIMKTFNTYSKNGLKITRRYGYDIWL